jgi:anti-sigma factor RsiW
MEHPRTELIPYLRGELSPPERDVVEAHLVACAACRAERDAFADLMLDLRRSAPETPPVDWARWRAELRARVPRRARRSWLGPLPLGAGVAVVAAALALTVWLAVERSTAPPEWLGLDPGMLIGDRAEPLAAALPEDIELIAQLDRLAGGDR